MVSLNGDIGSYSSPAALSGSRELGQQSSAGKELSAEEKKVVEELKQRDAEVRRHEQAHLAAAGQYARGGATYEYQVGPDGRRYAVGGEVNVDTSPVADDPEQTIQKARTIRRAALAPEEPSAKDRQVAAEAARMEAEARRELAQQKQEEDPTGYTAEGQPSREPAPPSFLSLIS